MNPADLHFFFCIEPGVLEGQGLLLARSLRRFGGFAADAPIYAVRPRPGPSLDPDTGPRLAELGVQLLPPPPGQAFEFPRLNKVRAAAWIEKQLDGDTLVFLDTDTLFVAPPEALRLGRQWLAAVRPVDSKNICSSGRADPVDAYWQEAYRLCGCPEPPWAETTVDREQIRGCWNSGLVGVQRSAGVFQSWLNNVETLLQHQHLPRVRPRPGVGVPFIDQVALSATLAGIGARVRTLPWSYNYCLPKRGVMAPTLANAPWEALVHVHYHRWFNKPGFVERLRPGLAGDGEVYAWLSRHLPLSPHNDERMPRQRGPRLLHQRARARNAASRRFPGFFVVGTGRCGTNLLRTILNAHPQVCVVRESHWLPVLLERFGDRVTSCSEQFRVIDSVYMAKGMTAFERLARFNRLTPRQLRARWDEELAPLEEATPRELMTAFYRQLARLNGARMIGDKTPDYGFCMGRLARVWPGARFVHIARDGRDVALSMAKTLSFRYLASHGETSWTDLAVDRKFLQKPVRETDPAIDDFFQLWRKRLSAIRKEAETLDPERYLEIRYEAMLENPRESLQRVGDFLELSQAGPWPGQMAREALRYGNWLRVAAGLIKPNLGKNAGSADYRSLTAQFAETLQELGFEP